LPGTFAPEKGDDPEKYTKGLGLNNSSFPDVCTRTSSRWARTRRRADGPEGVEAGGHRPDRRRHRVGVRPPKPVSTYIAGCLEQVYDGDFTHANKGERKFACLAGTQAIDDAYNWIRAGRNRRPPGDRHRPTPRCTPAATPARRHRAPAPSRC